MILGDKINAAKSREILERNLFPSAGELQLQRAFIFWRDDDPKHPAEGGCSRVGYSKPRPQSNKELEAGLK